MKKNNLLLYGFIGVLGLWWLTQKASGESSNSNGEISPYTTAAAFPEVTKALNISAQPVNMVAPNNEYTESIRAFLNTPVNTQESIKTGLNVINTAFATQTELPRISETIKNVGYNSNIAKLADGSIKQVTVLQPKKDAQGKTALDRMIESNKAKRK